MRVRKNSKRADGLIALKKNEIEVFTAVVEAKSYRTLHSIIPIDGDDIWVYHGIIIGFLAAVIIGLLVPFSIWLRIGISIAAFLAAASLFWFATSSSTHYRFIRVLDQIKHYPSHEKWIAFSMDAYNHFSSQQISDFEQKLRKIGIGLLIISPNKKVKVSFEPANDKKFKNLVVEYNRCNEILKFLECHLQ